MKIVRNRSGQRVEDIPRDPVATEVDSDLANRKLIAKFEEGFDEAGPENDRGMSPAFLRVADAQRRGRLRPGKRARRHGEAFRDAERTPKFSRSVWRFRGRAVIQTYRVEYLGPDGRWRKSRGMDLYKIRDGLIARKDAYWKMIP